LWLLLFLLLTEDRLGKHGREEQRGGSTQGKAMSH
jgi:hypothetical protein